MFKVLKFGFSYGYGYVISNMKNVISDDTSLVTIFASLTIKPLERNPLYLVPVKIKLF